MRRPHPRHLPAGGREREKPDPQLLPRACEAQEIRVKIRSAQSPIKRNLLISADHQTVLRRRMERLAIKNPSWGFSKTDEQRLYEYLAVQLITFLEDEELYDLLTFTDHHVTGKQEELLDAYLILDQGSEIEVKLFQFKFSKGYKGGVSTKELYNFVSLMNGWKELGFTNLTKKTRQR